MAIYKKYVLLLLVLATVVPVSAQWGTLSVDGTSLNVSSPYRRWQRYGISGYIYDTIYLLKNSSSGSDAEFNNQTLANPHVQYTDTGEWLIMGYGDHNLDYETTRGDAIYVIKRHSDGRYTIPHQTIPGQGEVVKPALAFPHAEPGKSWLTVGGLGTGAGIAKTPTPSAMGYKYFALLAIGKDHNSSMGLFQTGWVTWAVSTDGLSWMFVNSTGTDVTADPAASLKLIRRSDLANWHNCHGSYQPRLYHSTLFYNPENGYGGNYFYILQGYGGCAGVKATWWRIPFNPTKPYGITVGTGGAVTVQRLTATGYVNTNGIVPTDDGWVIAAQDPKPILGGDGLDGPADPMDLVQLRKQNGAVDSMLFLYRPERDFDDDGPTFYVKASLPTSAAGNFVFQPQRELDTSPITNQGFSECGAGNFFISVNQSGWQANGYPSLYGFAGTRDINQHPIVRPCQVTSQGFQPFKFTLY